jgi:hypothetical protein
VLDPEAREAMYAPQLFQGTSGDVTVPASSTVRDSIRGAIPRFANSARYTRLGMTMATYWSPAMTFSPIAVPMTAAISRPVERAAARTGRISRSRNPACSITAAKDRAPSTSQIVLSIDAIPPREKSASIVSLPVCDTNPVASAE